MFTPRSYNLIAWELRNERQMLEYDRDNHHGFGYDPGQCNVRLDQLNRCATLLSNLFRADNPNYNEQRFFRAIGLERDAMGSYFPMTPPSTD